MIDTKLVKNEDEIYDLSLVDGSFEMAEDGAQSAGHVANRLLTHKGEYSLGGKIIGDDDDGDDGTDFYGIIFDVSKSRAEKDFELKRRILGTPDANKIVKLDWTQTEHTVSILGAVDTKWGIINIDQEVSPL